MVNRSFRGESRTQVTRLVALLLVIIPLLLVMRSSIAQQPEAPADEGPTASSPDQTSSEAGLSTPEGDGTITRVESEGLNLLELIISGGWFIAPIALMSLISLTFIIERSIALRRERIIPSDLVSELASLGESQGSFDPRAAFRLCQSFPSAASKVIQAMLLKVGRPQSEVDRATTEASEREVERLYSNVRWLNLSAAVTPLMGLLGTVWGMIRAFHDTSNMPAGQNKADYLAEGIYLALVTTLCGLIVAIPSAIFSHYFEGRLQKQFHEVDELMFGLMPQVERFEGKMRFTRNADESPDVEQEEG